MQRSLRPRKYKHSEMDERFNDIIKSLPSYKKITDTESKTTESCSSNDEFTLPLNKKSMSLEAQYKLYCQQIINKYERLMKLHPNKNYDSERHYALKRCENCRDFRNDKHMLLCDVCDDAYHYYCTNPPMKSLPNEDDDFICTSCQKILPRTKKFKQMKINESLVFDSPNKLNKKHCNKCSEECVYNSKQCLKCKKDFHLKCFNKSNKASITCGSCDTIIEKTLKDMTITSFYKSEKKKEILIPKVSKMSDKSQGNFLLPRTLNKTQKTILQESLFKALLSKDIQFNDDLCFPNDNCKESMNNALKEPGVQEISDYNKKIYYKFKEMSRKAEYCALEILLDEVQGFVVKATADIPNLTLICEYTGEVCLARDKLFDKNDSIMELIKSPSCADCLVIAPEKFGNIARFLSGINNTDSKSKKKQNVKSIKFSIDGSVHILLYACRTIKKGQLLYYDYNAGGYGNYPTEHFK